MASQTCSPLHTRRSKLVFWSFAAIAAFYLLTEHRAHVFAFLPYLLVLACPLMHLFHHGHGHERTHDVTPSDSSASASSLEQRR